MLTSDICILGGGNAGLSLALQLRARLPQSSITVLEHRGFPAPHAAHKVGESTVEIAAHYLAEELGLREHLEQEHLHKFGLRFFFAGDRPPDDMAGYDEVGPSRSLPIATYQIDRGILENHLAALARQRGIELLDRATVQSVDLAAGRHQVAFTHEERSHRVVSRFVVDASGRRAWLASSSASSARPATPTVQPGSGSPPRSTWTNGAAIATGCRAVTANPAASAPITSWGPATGYG